MSFIFHHTFNHLTKILILLSPFCNSGIKMLLFPLHFKVVLVGGLGLIAYWNNRNLTDPFLHRAQDFVKLRFSNQIRFI